jgi:hypothetical protein
MSSAPRSSPPSSHPLPSEGVDHRPIRVRIEPPAEDPPRRPARVTRRGVLAVVALLVLTFVAAQSCQQSQIRIAKEQAIETARPEAGFEPQRTQVRLVRQGLDGHPFWAISFSIRAPSGEGYERLTTVRVDAVNGRVESVNRER